MRWIEVITEAKFRQPRLMYHGTSSAFLRSILQQGLVPDPKNKYWANDPQEAQHAFDRSSLYGSYWTSNLMTASSSASNTRKKFGGDDDLIIIAQIAEQSAYADEDDIDHSIRWAACDTVHTLHPHIRSDFWLAIADQLFGTDRIKVQNLFMINLHAHLKGSDQHPPNRELCDSLLDTLVLRSIAFEKKNGLTFSHWVTALKASDIPSIKELEQQLLDLRERISRAYRSSAFYIIRTSSIIPYERR